MSSDPNNTESIGNDISVYEDGGAYDHSTKKYYDSIDSLVTARHESEGNGNETGTTTTINK